MQSWRPRANAFCVLRFSQSTYLKYCACHEKVMPGHTKCCAWHAKHLARKIISANLKIWGSKIQPVSGNQHPDLLTALMNMSLSSDEHEHVSCTALATENASSSTVHACHRCWKCHKTLTFCSLLTRCTIPCACRAKRRLNLQTRGVFNILTSKCASHHNGVHFFDISTSKSGPNLVYFEFVYFDFEMCFALQRRAIFHLSSGQLALHPPL